MADPREFLIADSTSDNWDFIVADDLPEVSGLNGVLDILHGGTGRSTMGPTNTVLVVGGASGLYYRFIGEENLSPALLAKTTSYMRHFLFMGA